MRPSRASAILTVGVLMALVGLAGCTPTARQAEGADEWDNPVGSLWWSKDVHACVVNDSDATIPIFWYTRTGGDTNKDIAPGDRSCASDGHSALSTTHSMAEGEITVAGRNYFLVFENPPVWKPQIVITNSPNGSVLAKGDGSEGWTAEWTIDGHTFTAKRLNDSPDAKELELRVHG